MRKVFDPELLNLIAANFYINDFFLIIPVKAHQNTKKN